MDFFAAVARDVYVAYGAADLLELWGSFARRFGVSG